MELKLIELVAAYDTLEAIKKANTIPIALAWAIDDIAAAMAEQYERYHKKRQELVLRFGTPDKEQPEAYKIPAGDKLKAFNEEHVRLASIKVKIEGFERLKKQELLDAQLKVPAEAKLANITPFIE